MIVKDQRGRVVVLFRGCPHEERLHVTAILTTS